MLTGNNRFTEMKASGKLPSPHGIALEIMRLTGSTNASLQDVVAVARLDPALTGRLVQFANSAHHAFRRPVASTIDAVRLLGLHTVRQFALSLSVIGANQNGACAAFDYGRFWSVSLARALVVQELTTLDNTVAPEEAFTCGILANIGQLALASVYPEAYGECLCRMAPGDGERLIEAEREVFAIDHRQVTRELLGDWGFPAILVEAIGRQYEAAAGGTGRTERFAAQLRLASELGRYFIADPETRHGAKEVIMPAAHELGLDQGDLDEICRQVGKQWPSYCELLQIPSRGISSPISIESKVDEIAESDALPSRPMVLLINDDRSELTRLEGLLKSSGYEVNTAASDDEALASVLQDHPRLVIVEHRDAERDGIRFCQRLRALAVGRQIYLMMLAASPSEDEVVQAYAGGINDLVVRPVNDRVLLARIAGGERMVQLQAENDQEREKVRKHVSKLAIAKRKLETMAMTDPLTRIPNRRYAFARLREEWAAWHRTGRPLSVMVVDLDHFKQVNDNFGHQMGDRLLTHVADVIRTNLRASDVVCRLGGEEFIVIAPSADETVAHALAERLRDSIEHRPLPGGDIHKGVTASIGIATISRRTANPTDLVNLADRALYDAKLAGRNQVRANSGW